MNTITFKSPKILAYDDEKRDEYDKEWSSKPVEERFNYVQSLLKKHDVSFDDIKDLTNKKEQLKFMKEDLHCDEDDVYVDFELGNFDRILEMFLYDKRLFINGEVFGERVNIGEIVDIYPSIWVSILKRAGITLSINEFTVTVDGKEPVLDDDCEFKTIEISFSYKDNKFDYTYVCDEIYDDMIDFNIFNHIERFLHAIDMNLFFLTLNNDFGSTHFLLPFEVVEGFDRYKERG